MTLWERFRNKIHDTLWGKIMVLEWDNRHLRKENIKLQEELMKLAYVLERHIEEKI